MQKDENALQNDLINSLQLNQVASKNSINLMTMLRKESDVHRDRANQCEQGYLIEKDKADEIALHLNVEKNRVGRVEKDLFNLKVKSKNDHKESTKKIREELAKNKA